MMTIIPTASSVNSETLISTWQRTDIKWMFCLYGTAIGSGVLFLPINAGMNGILPLVMMAVLSYPMIYFSHRGLTRFVLSSKDLGKDIIDVVEEHFGVGIRKKVALLYFFSIYPILLVYSVAITNTVESFISNQLHMNAPPRYILSLILTVFMMNILRLNEKIIVRTISVLAFPFIISIILLAIYLIPQWNCSFLETALLSKGHTVRNGLLIQLWLTVPVTIFSFNHSPIISSFAIAKRKEYGKNAEKKCAIILARSHAMMIFTVMFFVFSCVLSLSPSDLSEAKQQNISILSCLANHFDIPIINWIAPIIAVIAIIKSFLGHYLGARESFNGIITKPLGIKNKSIKVNNLNEITAIFTSISTWMVSILNPSILNIIEIFIGPIITIILFMIPICAIPKVPSMNRYRGQLSNVFILIMGLIAISSIFVYFI